MSVNLIDDTTVAGVSGLTSLSSGGTAASNVSIDADADGTGDSTFVLGHGLTAKARNDALALSGAGSLTVGTGKSAGLAGAFTWNQLEKITRATITGTQITVGGTGSLLLDAYNTGPMWSVSAGAANGQKAGVAGSVAYSTVNNTTEAAVDGAVVNAGGSVSLVAKDDSDIRSVAGAASYGGKAGIGAGVAISTVVPTRWPNSAAAVRQGARRCRCVGACAERQRHRVGRRHHRRVAGRHGDRFGHSQSHHESHAGGIDQRAADFAGRDQSGRR